MFYESGDLERRPNRTYRTYGTYMFALLLALKLITAHCLLITVRVPFPPTMQKNLPQLARSAPYCGIEAGQDVPKPTEPNKPEEAANQEECKSG